MNRAAKTERIDWIDVMKGLGMFLVILGHIMNSRNVNLCVWLWSFHMPLFFFASGLVKSGKTISGGFLFFLRKKVFSLMIPHLTLSVYTLLKDALDAMAEGGLREMGSVNIISSFSSWFLPALFAVELIWYVRARVLRQWLSTKLRTTMLALEVLTFLC